MWSRHRLRRRRRRGRLIEGDRFQLQRFVAAQDGGTYAHALSELRAGEKRGHWMWFVFPQLEGLGSSPTARRYALSGLEEARAYLAHPLLGARLAECCDALLELGGDALADEVLGMIDALKLRSSMTLLARAGDLEGRCEAVLERFYAGQPDPLTERLLAHHGEHA